MQSTAEFAAKNAVKPGATADRPPPQGIFSMPAPGQVVMGTCGWSSHDAPWAKPPTGSDAAAKLRMYRCGLRVREWCLSVGG